MAEEIKVNRPQSSSQAQAHSSRPEYSRPSGDIGIDKDPSSSKMPWVILGVVVVVLVVLGVLFRGQIFGKKNGSAPAASASSGYQAVFLTNGQVYFGKLSQANTDYPVLTDIYYLQVVQPPLQGQQSGTTPPAANSQSQISLVKLGNELHGPVDEMHISRPQILFYEDLKSDGQVVKAIQAYKANPTAPAAPVGK